MEIFFKKIIETNVYSLFGGPYFGYSVIEKIPPPEPGQPPQSQGPKGERL
jgi:hypothetical protein